MNELLSASQTIYALAASPDGVCFAAHAAGLERSVDGGRTWQSAYASIDAGQRPFTAAVALSPAFASDRTVWAGVAGGVLRSADGGRTWQRVGTSALSGVVNAIVLAPTYLAPPHLLVIHDGALLISRNDGESWEEWASSPGSAITAVAAPDGLRPGVRILVGLFDGRVASAQSLAR